MDPLTLRAVALSALLLGPCLSRSASAQTDTGANSVLIQVWYQPQPGEAPFASPADRFHIAASAKEWNPASYRCDGWAKLQQPPAGPPPIIQIATVPRDIALAPDFEFKVTRGTWDTVEVDSTGADIPNRTLDLTDSYETLAGLVVKVTVAGFADQRPTRWHSRVTGAPSVIGTLETHDFASAVLRNTRKVRVWLPPGYSEPARSTGEPRCPVLYMHDGQNLFDASTSFAGEWRVDETLSDLIAQRRVPPIIVVGIDNAGDARMEEYTPIPIGPRREGRGGHADAYLRMITEELIPWVDSRYRTLTGPQYTAMGGSSLGGIVTIHAAMTRPGLFGAILVESPALWVGEGAFLARLEEQRVWPQRVFLAMGGAEYGDAAKDAELVSMHRQAEAAFRAAGLTDARLRAHLDPAAKHNEQAWANRLPQALEFLFAK